MSRLIEALRKAEEQKRKEDIKKESADSTSFSTKKSESPSAPDERQKLSTPEQETSKQGSENDENAIEFELEPIEQLTPENTNEEQAEIVKNVGPLISNSSPALELDTGVIQENRLKEEDHASDTTDQQPVISKPSESANSEDQRSFTRRQTDTIQLEVLPDTESTSDRSKKLVWVLLISFIFLSSGGGYFLYFYQSNENQYPVNNYSQNRGFIDTSKNTDNASQNQVGNDSVLPNDAVEENSLLESAQNLVESATNVISDNTIETISAVNALLEETDQAPGQELTKVSQKNNTILRIKRAGSIQGTSSSLSFAQDNVLGGEKDAARMEYEELLRNQPTNRSALIGLATLEAQAGNTDLARQRYSQLLQIDPKDPVAQIGILETDTDDFAAYEAGLKTIASRHASSAFIPFKLGNLLASQNRWSEAKYAYETALRTAQENNETINADYAFNLAIALEKTQRPIVALKKYKEAKKLSNLAPYSFDTEILNNRINDLEREL